jgi:hypothetical protein
MLNSDACTQQILTPLSSYLGMLNSDACTQQILTPLSSYLGMLNSDACTQQILTPLSSYLGMLNSDACTQQILSVALVHSIVCVPVHKQQIWTTKAIFLRFKYNLDGFSGSCQDLLNILDNGNETGFK